MLGHLLKKEKQTAAKQAHSLSREIGKNLKKLL
jgi:hypothetical protein